jgi:hypothetical protein
LSKLSQSCHKVVKKNVKKLSRGALTPINQNAIKQGECGNLERNQTERDKSELDKANILAHSDFAQTDFAQTELAKNHVLQIWNPINQNLECNQTTK